MAKKKRNRTSPDAVLALDVLCYELEGEDPRPMVELPEGVNVGTCTGPNLDAIGTVYDDNEDSYLAVMVVAVRGPSAADAAAALRAQASHVAGELFDEVSGHPDADVDQEDDDE